MTDTTGTAGKIARFFIDSKLTPLVVVASLLLGFAAVVALPREEEPQIIVPMIDIFVQMPGASAKEVEQRITSPMEKLLWEIPGVEYVYTTSSPGMSMAVVRFFVGQDEEESIVRLQSKLLANFDRIPWAATPPLIKPRYIDDVPILALTFWSRQVEPYTLRRVAAEVETVIKREPNVSITSIIGGAQRQVQVLFDPLRLASVGIDLEQAAMMLQAANQEADTGVYPTRLAYSEDGGNTWSPLQTFKIGDHPLTGTIVLFSDIIQLKDGSYMATFHNREGIAYVAFEATVLAFGAT